MAAQTFSFNVRESNWSTVSGQTFNVSADATTNDNVVTVTVTCLLKGKSSGYYVQSPGVLAKCVIDGSTVSHPTQYYDSYDSSYDASAIQGYTNIFGNSARSAYVTHISPTPTNSYSGAVQMEFWYETTYTTTFTKTVAKGTSAKNVSWSVNFVPSVDGAYKYDPASETWKASGTVSIPALPSYTISYNANGGTGAPSAQIKYYNTTLTLSSTTPTKANTVTYPTGTITISYNANGGSSTPNNGTGQYTNTKTVPYTFKNWNTNSAGTGTSYNAGASYTANAAATLYAQWNTGSATETRTTNPRITMPAAISRANGSTTGYTVTFNVNGGSSSHNAVTSTRTITYTFGGWNTNSSGTGTNYSASTAYTFSENDTLYAKWTPSYTNNAITLPTPTRSGYKFLGWATTSTASSGTTGSYTPSSNITLYAIWEALATMFVKVSSTYKAGAPYVKVNNTWKKAIGVYVKVGNQWKLSTR